MDRWSERRAAFRALLAGQACVFPASVFDPLSARLAERTGFETLMLAGSVASLAVLGAPDLIVLTLSEFAGLALRINRVATRPMIVDADHGYGDALNVARTVEELEIAGVAGLTIEDTDLPGRFGASGQRLISLEEGVGKMKAAVAARRDPSLVIFARTGAVATNGIEEAAARIKAYQETGVDGIFLSGVKTRAELEAMQSVARLPLMLGAITPALSDRLFLSARGVRVALQGHAVMGAVVEAVRRTYEALHAGTPPESLQGIAPDALMRELARESDYKSAIAAYLKG